MILYVLILIDFIAPKFIKLIDFKYFFVYFQNAYDDRYIVQNAAAKDGIIVSNDQFRDLMDEEESFKDAIENRLLNFNFVTDKDGISDTFMVPHDPRGKNGPRLEQFLMF